MDGDGTSFPFPSASDFNKGQDASDISWGDIFLDGIHSDDPSTSDTGGLTTDTSSLGTNIHVSSQQITQQSQSNVIGGQVQIHIPTHLQGSLTNNVVQQTSKSLGSSVAYLAPSASSQSHLQVSTAGRIQNVMAAAGQQQVTASVGHQQPQSSAKLVQIAPSFPMASVQQLTSGVPIQTLLQQSNQTLAGQTIYGSSGTGLFPTQGSVHIENPKVVNVNFGPHVIGSDGSGQQAIIHTAEGKRVLITNSQLQHMSQSISLTQPIVGTQLINPAGGNVIRASMAQGTHTIVPSSTTTTRQIVLPSGQTVIPRQANSPQTGLAKNVVLRQLNPNMSPVIYQSGQGGQLIHPQPTLLASSGPGLQVVNTAGSQGSQVQLIAQPSINQAGMGQQQLNQNTIMNLINNQGVIPSAGNQITGLVPGQNILVNGQMFNIGQLGGLQPLQVQQNPQGAVTLASLNTSVTRPAQFQPTTQHLVIQHNGQQQQIMLQPKSTPSPSLMTSTVPSQRLSSSLQGNKMARPPTPNTNSASSTPVPTPTPSTPTPTPTPDLMSDFCGSGGKSNQTVNILEQALEMSDIDLQSFEDDFNLFGNSPECFSSVTPPPSITPQPQQPKSKPQAAKSKSKSSKSKSKTPQPIVNVTVNNSTVPFQQPTTPLQNTQGQKVTLSPQQKIITANGQVYVLSANGQQLILQPSASSASPIAPQLKPIASQASTAVSSNRTNVSIPSTTQLQIKGFNQQVITQTNLGSTNVVGGQLKLNPQNLPVTLQQQKNVFIAANPQMDSKVLIKTGPDLTGAFKLETTSQSVTAAQIVFTSSPLINQPSTIISQAPLSQTNIALNQAQLLQVKNQKITTLSGTFVKQEPSLTTIVKQEPVTDLQTSVSPAGVTPTLSPMLNLSSSTPIAVTTSNLVTMTTPLVISSASFTAVTTTTTHVHQTTIMSTAQMAGSQQTSVSSSSSFLPHSSAFSDSASSSAVSIVVCQAQSISSTSTHNATSAVTTTHSTTTTSSKSSSKEKDPATIKTMTPIKIANSTLMLSLTPVQKERLENQLSRMSMKDQNEFLVHQQNIIRRSQQVQQKQLEQQQKYQQQQQQKQKLQLQQQQLQQQQQIQQQQQQQLQKQQQQQAQQQPQEFQQQAQQGDSLQQQMQQSQQQIQQQQMLQQQQIQQQQQLQQQQQIQQQQQQQQLQQQLQQHMAQQQNQSQQQQQSQQQVHVQLQGTATKLNLSSQAMSRQELMSSSSAGQSMSGLPTTVQELIDKVDEKGLPQHLRTSMKPQEQQPQQPLQSVQQSQLPLLQQQQQQLPRTQQQMSSPAPGTQNLTPVQQFVIPQGRCLAEQQLIRDRSLALGPDMTSPFKSLSDAMRRLVRYHTLQDHKPEEGSKQMRAWDTRYNKLCEYLVKKKRCYMRRFNKMKLYHDMCAEKRSENLQNLICFNEQLRELIDEEREEARTQPDTFKPLKPEPVPYEEDWPSTSDKIGPEEFDQEEEEVAIKEEGYENTEVCEKGDFDADSVLKEKAAAQLRTVTEQSDSPYASPSGRKRKFPDVGSSGTLKLVFKRRTTDNFVVKNSSATTDELPQDLKPVVNVDKSDSEYEYDSQPAGVTSNQPVIVRRRTISVASRQVSFEAGSDSGSVISHPDKARGNSSDEEEEEEDADREDSNGEEEEEREKSVSDEDEDDDDDDEEEEESSLEEKKSSKGRYVSFGDEVAEDNDLENGDACSDADAFMETDELTSESETAHHFKNNSGNAANNSAGHSVFKYSDISDFSRGRKSSRQLSQISDDVFNSNLSFPHADPSDSEDVGGVSKNVDHKAFSFEAHNDSNVPSSFVDSPIASSLTQEEEEFVTQSPVSNIEKEAARKGLPSSTLFTTPNKSLLQTDAMFNSSSEDEDEDGNGGGRLASAFEIDNKDPQSSMINDSVRSAINSVLNDEDDENDDSQASWTSSAHRPPSSSSITHNIFQSSSSSIPSTHDADLDAAVQSILNG